jgi:hypothetical protein
MNSIVIAWILVGVVANNSRTAPPPSHLFPSKEVCEAVMRAENDVAPNSSLRCVQTSVLKP